VRNDREGYVIEPYAAEEWIAAIRRMAEDTKVRQRMSAAAAERAQSYIWSAVARRRRHQIVSVLSDAASVSIEAETVPGLLP
jgi:glycosyltransferase involved in cell wall biosynthesis